MTNKAKLMIGLQLQHIGMLLPEIQLKQVRKYMQKIEDVVAAEKTDSDPDEAAHDQCLIEELKSRFELDNHDILTLIGTGAARIAQLASFDHEWKLADRYKEIACFADKNMGDGE